MPPRRMVEYVNMYVDNNQEIDTNNVLKYNDINYVPTNIKNNTDNKNYYVSKYSKGYFIFNNYKGSLIPQCLEINPELHYILKSYLSLYKINNNDKLFNHSRDKFNQLFKKIFSYYTTVPMSYNVICNMYLSHIKTHGIFNNNHLSFQMGINNLKIDDYPSEENYIYNDILLDGDKKILKLCINK
jgi:hypothetical protein